MGVGSRNKSREFLVGSERTDHRNAGRKHFECCMVWRGMVLLRRVGR